MRDAIRVKTASGRVGRFLAALAALLLIAALPRSDADELQSLPEPPVATATPEPIILPAPLYKDRNHTMVMVRPICDFLGAKMAYADRVATIVMPGLDEKSAARSVTFRVGGTTASVHDAEGLHTITIDGGAEERLGNIFVGLNFFARAFGVTIEGLIITSGPRRGILQTPVALDYRGKDAVKLTIRNRVGRAISLRLTGPVRLSYELGRSVNETRKVPPGVYYYLAASHGMKPRSGARRLLAGRTVNWDWGHG